MSIAEKSIIIAENVPKVYQAGYNEGYAKAESENPLYYITTMEFAFANVAFPENNEIVCKVLNNTKWNSAFLKTSGIKTLKIISDTPNITMGFQALVRQSKDLELLDLNECICFPTTMAYFAYDAYKLKTILGAFDLSQCTVMTNAFVWAEALEDIEFVPNTIKISINFGNSGNLTNASKQSIIDGLATVETAQTLTLHANLKILQSQVDSANAKGWTVAGGTVVSEEEYYG